MVVSHSCVSEASTNGPIQVAWLNRPEDLDTSRKPYHGKNELIASNQLEIIDAMVSCVP